MGIRLLAEEHNATAQTRMWPRRGPMKKSHILVVDDENGPRQALRMLLKEDYRVHLAMNVMNALEVLEKEPIELIITDVRMPKLTGVDLLCESKKSYPDVQVVVLTGYGQLETAVKAVEYGAFAYMEKPFDNDALLDVVRGALDKYRCEGERRALEYLALEANRFETLGRVVSGMMHDMGSPLSVLGSQLELLTANPARSDLKERFITMRAQVDHCNDMVRSTMNFLRSEGQETMLIGLNSVVESCLEVGRPMLRDRNVEVTLDLKPDVPAITGDLVLVRQAVLNLITNACQAMESQPERKELTIGTWSTEERVCLSIEDTGPGVPEDVRDQIFDTFFSTKGKSGTGLGLSVVKNAMRRLNGSVELEDNLGRGACFVLRFPVPR